MFLDRYGMPDLFIDHGTEWAFVEVKMPPDSLRLNQILRLAAHEVPVRILWWIEPSRMPAFTFLQLTQYSTTHPRRTPSSWPCAHSCVAADRTVNKHEPEAPRTDRAAPQIVGHFYCSRHAKLAPSVVLPVSW